MEKVVAWLLIVAGLAGSWFMLVRPIAGIVDSRFWSPEKCEITGSDLRATTSRDSSSSSSLNRATTTHAVEITYRYIVRGQEYVSSRYSFLDGISGTDFGRKQRITAKYPTGRVVTCYVNPQDPTAAVLNRSFTADMLLGLIPLGMLALGFFGAGLLPRSMSDRIGYSLLDLVSRVERKPKPVDSGEGTSRILASNFQTGLVAAVFFALMAVSGAVAAIGDEVSDTQSLSIHAAIAVALAYAYSRRLLFAALALIAYPVLLGLLSLAFDRSPHAATTLQVWLLAALPVPSLASMLAGWPDRLASYVRETASFSPLLIPIGLGLVRGAESIAAIRGTGLRGPAMCVGVPSLALAVLVNAAGWLGAAQYQDATQPPMSALEVQSAIGGSDPRAAEKACAEISSSASDPSPDLFQEVSRAAEHSRDETRGACVAALVRFPGHALDTIPLLRRALADPSPYVRITATSTLGTLAAKANHPEVIADLAPLVSDAEPQVRRFAVLSLAPFGEAAQSALPVLQKALTDSSTDVRQSAAQVLDALGPLAAPATDDLAKALSDPDAGVRQRVAEALGAIGASATTAIDSLSKATKDPSEVVRQAAVSALALVDPDSPAAIERLASHLTDQDDRVRAEALVALEKLGPKAAPAVPAIIPLLSQDPIYIRVFAVDALTAIGPAAATAVPRLKEMLTERLITDEVEARRLPETLKKALEAIQPVRQP